MAKTLRDISAGDTVFVVKQSRCGNGANYETVTRVGRSYGYIELYGREQAFSLDTGYSKDGQNLRVNGLGFDVYASQKEYEQAEEHRSRSLRLKGILELHVVPRLRRFEVDADTVKKLLSLTELFAGLSNGDLKK